MRLAVARLLQLALLCSCTAARGTCEVAFPFLGSPASLSPGQLPAQNTTPGAGRSGSTASLVDLLKPETISWWLYTLNTMSNFVPCAAPWTCREQFLAEWDPDLFDWDGDLHWDAGGR